MADIGEKVWRGKAWREKLRQGVAIPAQPLALDANRKLDERRQRALTRYYLTGAGGGRSSHPTRDSDPHRASPAATCAMEELGADASAWLALVRRVGMKEVNAPAAVAQPLLSFSGGCNASVAELIAHARAGIRDPKAVCFHGSRRRRVRP
jgi:hypothetical protein